MSGTYTNLLYHIVFSTKERRQLITPAIQDDLYAYLGGIVRGLDGILLEVNGIADHVHLLAKLPPKLALSDAVRDIKANSSKWLNEEKSRLYKFAWQDGFAAFSVSESQAERIRGYIRNQKTRHKLMNFKEELLGLLVKNRIDYDARYLWPSVAPSGLIATFSFGYRGLTPTATFGRRCALELRLAVVKPKIKSAGPNGPADSLRSRSRVARLLLHLKLPFDHVVVALCAAWRASRRRRRGRCRCRSRCRRPSAAAPFS